MIQGSLSFDSMVLKFSINSGESLKNFLYWLPMPSDCLTLLSITSIVFLWASMTLLHGLLCGLDKYLNTFDRG